MMRKVASGLERREEVEQVSKRSEVRRKKVQKYRRAGRKERGR